MFIYIRIPRILTKWLLQYNVTIIESGIKDKNVGIKFSVHDMFLE